MQRELVFVDYKIPPPVYSEDLFVAYFSNYQYAIADFCKKRNLQTAQFDKKEHLLQEIYLLKEIFDTIPKVSPFNVYRAFRIRLFALSTEVVSKEAR